MVEHVSPPTPWSFEPMPLSSPWSAEIPSDTVCDDIRPFISLYEERPWPLTFEICGGAPAPADAFGHYAAHIPGDPDLAQRYVAIERLGFPALPLDGKSRKAAAEFWQQNEVEVRFVDYETTENLGFLALIEVQPGRQELATDGYAFTVTNQGIVLATCRVLAQRSYAQLMHAEERLWMPRIRTPLKEDT